MTDILAGLGIQAARKWVLPAVLGAIGGAALVGLLIGVPAYFMVSGARDTAAAMTLERDAYKESASTQADAVKARDLTIARLNAQAIAILNDWRDTRADAAEVTAKTKALEVRHRAAEAELTEKSNAENADPVELAIDGLGRLCREQQDRTGAAAGGC